MKEHPHYRVLELLGESPRTVVHRAWDNSPLQRDVAIKMLRPEAAAVEHIRRQFWERVKALADLRHERLLPVFSTDAERDWVILELADDNAAARIGRGPSSPREVQSFLAQLLEGLEALHAKGRLHGQVKPANLLLYKSGRLKLADPGALVDGDLQLVPGGEKYLAPELADTSGRFGGGRPGPQLDLYGAGFCALEMLAGPRFDGLFPGMTAGGADTAALWWKWHASEADPRDLIESLVPASAGSLRTALSKMLAKRVAERAGSAREVLDLLGTAAIPEEIRVDAPPPAAAPAAVEGAARPARVSEIRYDQTAGGSPQTAAAASDSRRAATGARFDWRLPAAAAAVALALLVTGLTAWSWLASAREQARQVAEQQRQAAAQKQRDDARAAQERADAEKAALAKAEADKAAQERAQAEKAAREQEAAAAKAKQEQMEREKVAQTQAKPPLPSAPSPDDLSAEILQ
jgi:serine/threonine-protein kinase